MAHRASGTAICSAELADWADATATRNDATATRNGARATRHDATAAFRAGAETPQGGTATRTDRLATRLENSARCAASELPRRHVLTATGRGGAPMPSAKRLGAPGTGRWAATGLAIALLAGAPRTGAAAEPDAAEPRLRGLTPSLVYEGTLLSNLSGGRRTGSTAVGNLHLKLAAHGDAIGHPDTWAFVDVLTIHGGAPSRLVGDTQGTSNIEGPTGTQVEEAWVQQNFRGSSLSVLAGVYDLNSEFYTLQASGLFLNGSFGIGPEFAQSGVGGPSIFPRTSAGVRLAWQPASGSALRVALLDGAPVVRNDGSRAVFRHGDSVLEVVEFETVSGRGGIAGRPPEAVDRIGRFASPLPHGDKLAVGAWHYTGRYGDLSDSDAAGAPVQRRGSSGVYAVGEHDWLGRAAGREHLSGFFQAGAADPRTNRFAAYFGAGVVATGWGAMREADQLGLAVAHAVDGSHRRRAAQVAGGAAHAETAVELSYLTRFGKLLTVQPDLQYVIRPDASRASANAWVLQCRVKVEF